MKLLLEIKDDLFPHGPNGVTLRAAVRGIAFDEDGLMPLLFVSKHHYHKLPGGGVDAGESHAQALAREMQEETGCTMETLGEVGTVVEYRSAAHFGYNLQQTSHCWHGRITSKGQAHLEPGEVAEGFQLQWVTLAQAIELLEDADPDNAEGGFIVERDLTFLRRTHDLLEGQDA